MLRSTSCPLKRCNSNDDCREGNKSLESPLKTCKFDFNEYKNKVGQSLDVIRFLSSYGASKYLVTSNGKTVGVDIVLGKYLVICCVSLPLLDSKYYFDSIVTSYSELSRDRFEMVLVADMKPGFDDDDDKSEALFNDFFSGLPCLAIPFSKSHTRNHICNFIGFRNGTCCPDVNAILVDPTQTILHHDLTVYNFLSYGSDWFPFLQSTVDYIQKQDKVLRFRLDPNNPERRFKNTSSDGFMKHPLIRKPLSLHEDLLLCHPSLVLPRFGAANQPSSSVTVSELSNKYVGLYLFVGGGCLDYFLRRALQSRVTQEPPELVIIVVCVPLHATIKQMQKQIKRCFHECNNTATYFHPDNGKVWRRLWRVFAQESLDDEMVILPPNGQSGELYASVVIEVLEEKGYPFARSTLLQQTYTALKSLTPASLFKGTSTTKKRTCLIRNGRKSTVRQSAIKGKRLLLYLDWVGALTCEHQTDNKKLCCLLMEQYYKIQGMGWEVVFVPLDIEDEDEYHGMIGKMPWPITPFGEADETLQLLFPCVPPRDKLIAFEADGRMVSLDVKKRLEKCEFNDSMFYDNLYEDIFDDFYSLKSWM